MYCISDQEREALYGLPFRCRVLYHELRAWMDVGTRLTGVRRGISWQSLREALYVEPHQGEVESGAPHKEAIRRIAKKLESAGLIENRSEGKCLIFFLPLASAHHSAQKKPDTNPTQTRHIQPDTEPDTSEPHGNAGFEPIPDTEPDTNPTYPETPKPDTPQESRIKGKEERPTTADSAQAARRKSADYPPEFLAAMADYPARSGGNPERKAWRAWSARRKEGHTEDEMHAGVRRYAAWCDRTGKIGTEYVKQAATFFGPDKHFLGTFTPPASRSRTEDHLERVKRELRGEQGQIIEGRFSSA